MDHIKKEEHQENNKDKKKDKKKEEKKKTKRELYNEVFGTDYREHHVFADDGITLISDLLNSITEDQLIARSRCMYHARRLLMENEMYQV